MTSSSLKKNGRVQRVENGKKAGTPLGNRDYTQASRRGAVGVEGQDQKKVELATRTHELKREPQRCRWSSSSGRESSHRTEQFHSSTVPKTPGVALSLF